MYEVERNNEIQKEEINLESIREIRKMGLDLRDLYLFFILVAPVVIIGFTVG
jgi:hypothetical protein